MASWLHPQALVELLNSENKANFRFTINVLKTVYTVDFSLKILRSGFCAEKLEYGASTVCLDVCRNAMHCGVFECVQYAHVAT